VTFSWDTPADDHTPAAAIKYNLYVKKKGSEDAMFVIPADLNTGLLKVNELLTPITTTSYKLTGLENGNYVFGVQAIDNAKLTSQFETGEFTIGGADIRENPVSDPVISYKGESGWIISSDVLEWNEINVYNMQGMIVKKIRGKSAYTVIRDLEHGVYLAKVKINNESIIKKIVL
jgi:hypothetical protein